MQGITVTFQKVPKNLGRWGRALGRAKDTGLVRTDSSDSIVLAMQDSSPDKLIDLIKNHPTLVDLRCLVNKCKQVYILTG